MRTILIVIIHKRCHIQRVMITGTMETRIMMRRVQESLLIQGKMIP